MDYQLYHGHSDSGIHRGFCRLGHHTKNGSASAAAAISLRASLSAGPNECQGERVVDFTSHIIGLSPAFSATTSATPKDAGARMANQPSSFS